MTNSTEKARCIGSCQMMWLLVESVRNASTQLAAVSDKVLQTKQKQNRFQYFLNASDRCFRSLFLFCAAHPLANPHAKSAFGDAWRGYCSLFFLK
jgi:hypothetical protein